MAMVAEDLIVYGKNRIKGSDFWGVAKQYQ